MTGIMAHFASRQLAENLYDPPYQTGDTSWMQRAACRGIDPEAFFPDAADEDGIATAKAVCAACPVRDACLAYALEDKSLAGVWGGTTERERVRMRTEARERPMHPCVDCGALCHKESTRCVDCYKAWRKRRKK